MGNWNTWRRANNSTDATGKKKREGRAGNQSKTEEISFNNTIKNYYKPNYLILCFVNSSITFQKIILYKNVCNKVILCVIKLETNEKKSVFTLGLSSGSAPRKPKKQMHTAITAL